MKQNRKKKFLDFAKLTTSVLGKSDSFILQDSFRYFSKFEDFLIRMDIVIIIKCCVNKDGIFRVRYIFFRFKEITLKLLNSIEPGSLGVLEYKLEQ